MPTCCVCDVHCAKQYRCPRCKAPYCRLECFQKHKQDCSGTAVRQQGGDVEAAGVVEAVVAAQGPNESTTTYDAAIEHIGDRPVLSTSDDAPAALLIDDGCEELTILRDRHLAALAHDGAVRNQLKSVELQKLIRIVNNSRSRLDALDAALHNVPEFKLFCDSVLNAVYTANNH